VIAWCPSSNSALVPGVSTIFTCHGVVVLVQCWYSVVTVLLQCCYSVVSVLLQCCYSVVTVLLQCCHLFQPGHGQFDVDHIQRSIARAALTLT
jgi:hypothetical protein